MFISVYLEKSTQYSQPSSPRIARPALHAATVNGVAVGSEAAQPARTPCRAPVDLPAQDPAIISLPAAHAKAAPRTGCVVVIGVGIAAAVGGYDNDNDYDDKRAARACDEPHGQCNVAAGCDGGRRCCNCCCNERRRQ